MNELQRKLGFRRWHERQLYTAFAWLASCLLCGVLIAVILEFVGLDTPGVTPYLTLLAIYLVGLVGLTAFRRFWKTLAHAQQCASGATCSQCQAYGLFDVVVDAEDMPATCRRCGHHWTVKVARDGTGRR